MTEHEAVTIMAPAVYDGPPSVKIYCKGQLTSAYRDRSGEWFCACCAAGPLRIAW